MRKAVLLQVKGKGGHNTSAQRVTGARNASAAAAEAATNKKLGDAVRACGGRDM